MFDLLYFLSGLIQNSCLIYCISCLAELQKSCLMYISFLAEFQNRVWSTVFLFWLNSKIVFNLLYTNSPSLEVDPFEVGKGIPWPNWPTFNDGSVGPLLQERQFERFESMLGVKSVSLSYSDRFWCRKCKFELVRSMFDHVDDIRRCSRCSKRLRTFEEVDDVRRGWRCSTIVVVWLAQDLHDL